ncbi:MAG: 1-deoxy-D-xylulose-5-phosphate reductoisomerase [Bryobacterales bacterium]|nr:1-deoxy-D-xylulose-5-phosphate reductoisomerase [Bryobacterales bacterium]
MKRITILGSTGSIGTSTLDIVRRNPEKYAVHALVAGRNAELLARQVAEFQPAVVVVADDDVRADLQARLLAHSGQPQPALEVGRAAQEAVAAAAETDVLISAIVGVAGLPATYAAIEAGKRVGLANKETLVTAGALVMGAVARRGAELIPVDSEHNGAHQCLRAGHRKDVRKLILTASGGPFRETPIAQLASVTPAQALKHPTWKMGRRITIDSATLMNKGFEVIEACWLFDFPPAMVEVVVHPQSTVHAMVEYSDGSVIAQICATDMRMPIQYAITWPEREEAPVPRLDWREARTWEFHAPDFAKFPLLRLAYEAQAAGGASTCILNAADEIAVDAFLKERIPFPGIASIVEETLSRVPGRRFAAVDDVLEMDAEARRVARSLIAQTASAPAQLC